MAAVGDVSASTLPWDWLGPLSYGGADLGQGRLTSVSKVISELDTIAGYAARPFSASEVTGDSLEQRTQKARLFNNAEPTHAFRYEPGTATFSLHGYPVLTDLGVLPAGLHSNPGSHQQVGRDRRLRGH